MIVLPANHVSVFYMGPTTNTQFHAKCTYIIGQKHSHMVLLDHANISRSGCLIIYQNGIEKKVKVNSVNKPKL